MSTVSKKIEYPTSDGKPMAETEVHRIVMVDSIAKLSEFYAQTPDVHVSGNLLIFYVEGDKRIHVSPDVFVVKGVDKRLRRYFLTWEEGKGPDLVIEITSKSTKNEDLRKKFLLYQDVLGVSEYFLFDPFAEYIKPQLKGYRSVESVYQPIEPVEGRLPSEVTGLHLEARATELDFFDPATQAYRKTPEVMAQERAELERAGRLKEQAARQRAEDAVAVERALREKSEAELATLLAELASLRGGSNGPDTNGQAG